MKANLLLTVSAFLLMASNAHAKIWRVNNSATGTYGQNMGGTATYPVYKQLADANAANIVMAGDTVHLEGSNRLYDNATITKKLIIIGTGFFLAENLKTSSNGLQSRISSITFSNGSEGSQLIGVYVGESTSGLNINTSNILIRRCRLDYRIAVSFNISDIFIVENFFAKQGSNLSVFSTSTSGFPSHVIFNNNIVERTLTLPDDPAYTVDECKNNVFAGPGSNPAIQMYVGSFQNNILVNQNATVKLNGVSGPTSNPNVSHNVSALAATQFGTANSNIEANMANLFVNLATTTDAGYQLKPNSAASNNGSDGTDRGAFGGTGSQYVLSGLSPIPVIYEINTPGTAGPSGLPVSIKARTIK